MATKARNQTGLRLFASLSLLTLGGHAELSAQGMTEALPTDRAAAPARIQYRPTESVRVALSPGRAQLAALKIDRLLAAGRRSHSVTANDRIDDATFARRAYLTAIGRIPSVREIELFLSSTATDKRDRLVDRLLDQPGYTSHTANLWFDLLRVKSRQRRMSGEPFAHWIRESIRTSQPYDEFVADMISASGPAHQPDQGATGYLLRDANMPHDAMANTLRVFLGTRLECAQCHNHPTDKWTQQQFYGMAAFFGGLNYRADIDREVTQQMRAKMQGADDRTRRAARRALQTMSTGLSGSGTGIARLPEDYAYDDARPRSIVQAGTIFGAQVELDYPRTTDNRNNNRRNRGRSRRNQPSRLPQIGSRTAFADWLTAGANPRFATVAVGRLWQRLFGRSLIEPLDNLKDDSKAVYPQLQQHLERLLVILDYDLRQLQRVLMRTELFEAEVYRGDPPADQPFMFEGPVLRRLTAEQMWDSLLTLVFDDLDNRLRSIDARAQPSYQRYEQLASTSADELMTTIEREARRRANPARYAAEQRRQRQAQLAKRRTERNKLRRKTQPLRRQLYQALQGKDYTEVVRLNKQLEEMGAAVGQRAPRGREGDLLRASDLAQPAPAGHLLRQFGQSDRETIDGSSQEANVPQVLTLLNGFLDLRVFNGDSSLWRDLSVGATPQDRVRTAFLATLSREPSADEVREWAALHEQHGREALCDLLWVLCNSNEFRFWR